MSSDSMECSSERLRRCVMSARYWSHVTSNLILHDDDGEGDIFAVGQRERDGGDAEFAGALGGAAGEFEAGLAAGFAGDFEFEPVDAVADACAESLGPGLFGGEAGGEAFGGVLLALAVLDLSLGENAAQKAVAEAGDALRDACDLHQVRAHANHHRLLS